MEAKSELPTTLPVAGKVLTLLLCCKVILLDWCWLPDVFSDTIGASGFTSGVSPGASGASGVSSGFTSLSTLFFNTITFLGTITVFLSLSVTVYYT